jgi:hypothetical protein
MVILLGEATRPLVKSDTLPDVPVERGVKIPPEVGSQSHATSGQYSTASDASDPTLCGVDMPWNDPAPLPLGSHPLCAPPTLIYATDHDHTPSTDPEHHSSVDQGQADNDSDQAADHFIGVAGSERRTNDLEEPDTTPVATVEAANVSAVLQKATEAVQRHPLRVIDDTTWDADQIPIIDAALAVNDFRGARLHAATMRDPHRRQEWLAYVDGCYYVAAVSPAKLQ